MPLFQHIPLKQRLILISLLTTGIAMLFAGLFMAWAELISFKNAMVSDLSVKADIVGSQCAAALLFNVRKDADETLGSLSADEHIEYAVIYTKKNTPFAVYRRGEITEPLPFPPPEKVGYHFGIKHVSLYHNISLRGKRIGSVYIRSDLKKLYELLLRYVNVAAMVMVFSLLVAYVLVSKMMQVITIPIADLVHLMQGISRNKDYSLRAPDRGKDELAALASGFNEMLSKIQERDQELETHKINLESTVADLMASTEELQEANRKLKELDKLKSDFLSVVSHELRTPLTSIKAFVEIILMKPTMSHERRVTLLKTINSESNRLDRLITDLLDLAKIEAGKMSWRQEAVSIDDVVRDSVDALHVLARKKNIHLTATIPSDLPVIIGDRDRIVQVMNNLLSNSIKFTSSGGTIQIQARHEEDRGQRIVVEITDTGLGIPAKDLELIFDKFQRSGDQLTREIEGTGLGLSIARQIIEHHGGKIWAESTQGKGSTFFFTLPINKV